MRNGIVAFLFAVVMLGQFALGVVARAGGSTLCLEGWACADAAPCAPSTCNPADHDSHDPAPAPGACDEAVGAGECECCIRVNGTEAPSPTFVRVGHAERAAPLPAALWPEPAPVVVSARRPEWRPPPDELRTASRRALATVRLLI